MFDLNALKAALGAADQPEKPTPASTAAAVTEYAERIGVSTDALLSITMLSRSLLLVARKNDAAGARLTGAAAHAAAEQQMRLEILSENGQFAPASDAEQVARIAAEAVKLSPQEQLASEGISEAVAKFVRTTALIADNPSVINTEALLDLTNGHATLMRGLARLREGVTSASIPGSSIFAEGADHVCPECDAAASN